MKWLRVQEVDTESDKDLLEIELKNKTRLDETKRLNKQNAKHLRNGREKYNNTRSN